MNAATTTTKSTPDIDSSDFQTSSVQRASLIGGVALLFMGILGIFGSLVAVGSVVTPGDATQTATNLMNAEGTFRLGIMSLFTVAVLDVIVAWALYRVFEPVSRSFSSLTMWFRLVYVGVFVVAISHLVSALEILTTPEYDSVYSTQQLHTQALLQIETFYTIWAAGLLLFGIHLVLLGYLAYRSRYVPTVLGALLFVAGLGYAIDSVSPVLLAGFTFQIAVFTFIGEILLIVWLLVWGRHIDLSGQTASTTD